MKKAKCKLNIMLFSLFIDVLRILMNLESLKMVEEIPVNRTVWSTGRFANKLGRKV